MNKVIHAIWLGNKMTPLSFVCIDDWEKQGYFYKVWTENDDIIKTWIEECRFAKVCYEKKLYAFVTDYLRLKILKLEGGLYLDTDVSIQKNPFDLFSGVDFSVGFEDSNNLGTAVIYAKSTSKILDKLIEFYEGYIFKSDLYMGPAIMTHIINLEKNTSDVVKLYSQSYFYAYQGEHMKFEKPSDSYLIHWFQHSWGNTNEVVFLKSKNLNFWGRIYVWQKYFFKRINFLK